MKVRNLAIVGVISASLLLTSSSWLARRSGPNTTDIGFKAGPRMAAPMLARAVDPTTTDGSGAAQASESPSATPNNSASVETPADVQLSDASPSTLESSDSLEASAPSLPLGSTVDQSDSAGPVGNPLPGPAQGTVPKETIAKVADVLPVAQPQLLMSAAPPPAAPPPAAPPSSYSVALNVYEQRMFQSHNSIRQQSGLAGLQVDGTLEVIARQRAADMATNNYFSHYSPAAPGRAAVFSLLAAYGYVSKISGENIARNNYSDSQSADVAMNAFMASPGHRDNILDGRFRYVGIGFAVGANGMKYYSVVFAG